ncbi:MAG: WG repeat-containing protein [Bacteroidales bacterium]
MKRELILFFVLILGFGFLNAQNLMPQKDHGKWGYVDERDVFVIQPIYTTVGEFEGHYAWVNIGGKVKNPLNPIGGKWGIIDKTGKEVVPVIYDYVDLYNNDIVAVNNGARSTETHIEGGVWGFVDIKTGKEIVSPQYEQVGAFNDDGVAWVQKDGSLIRKVQVINIVDSKGRATGSKRALSVTPIYEIDNLFEDYNATGHWALINRDGKLLTGFDYCAIGDFHNGMAWVRNNEKYGVINQSGEHIIPLNYYKIEDFNEYGVTWVWKDEHKCGLIDKSGKELTDIKYNETGKFSNGVAWVKKNDLFGYVNLAGKEITPIIYDTIQSDFGKDSFVRFNKNDNKIIIGWVSHPKLGISWIDHEGNTIVPFEVGKLQYGIEDVIPNELWDY